MLLFLENGLPSKFNEISPLATYLSSLRDSGKHFEIVAKSLSSNAAL